MAKQKNSVASEFKIKCKAYPNSSGVLGTLVKLMKAQIPFNTAGIIKHLIFIIVIIVIVVIFVTIVIFFI